MPARLITWPIFKHFHNRQIPLHVFPAKQNSFCTGRHILHLSELAKVIHKYSENILEDLDHHFSQIQQLASESTEKSVIHSIPRELCSITQGRHTPAKISKIKIRQKSAKPECAKWRSDIVNISNIGN